MTNKIISSVFLVTSFPILEATPNHKDSILFLFISNNKVVAAVRVALALVMFALSFNYVRLTSKRVQKIIFAGGLAMMVFGAACLIQTSLGSILYNYIKFLDMMIVFEFGVILASTSLIAGQIPATAKVKPAPAAKASKTSAPQPA